MFVLNKRANIVWLDSSLWYTLVVLNSHIFLVAAIQIYLGCQIIPFFWVFQHVKTNINQFEFGLKSSIRIWTF